MLQVKFLPPAIFFSLLQGILSLYKTQYHCFLWILFSPAKRKKKKFQKNQFKIMKAENGLLYPLLGIGTLIAFVFMSFGEFSFHTEEPKLSFVHREGTQFMVDGRAFYVNGWNSYWLMDQAVQEFSRPRIGKMFRIGAKMGLTVCRTWAFNDGAYNALQVSLARFDQRVFKVSLHLILILRIRVLSCD